MRNDLVVTGQDTMTSGDPARPTLLYVADAYPICSFRIAVVLDLDSASHFSGLQADISPISLVQLVGSVRKFNLNRPFILPILGAVAHPPDVRGKTPDRPSPDHHAAALIQSAVHHCKQRQLKYPG